MAPKLDDVALFNKLSEEVAKREEALKLKQAELDEVKRRLAKAFGLEEKQQELPKRGRYKVPRHNRWLRKLTDDQVREARIRRAHGERVQTLADDYGVSIGTMDNLLKRATYQDVA
jgi:hypothetical protein